MVLNSTIGQCGHVSTIDVIFVMNAKYSLPPLSSYNQFKFIAIFDETLYGVLVDIISVSVLTNFIRIGSSFRGREDKPCIL